MVHARAVDGDTTPRIFDRIGRELLDVKWMLAFYFAASLAVLLLTLRVWARLA